jgi:hypothetical protein
MRNAYVKYELLNELPEGDTRDRLRHCLNIWVDKLNKGFVDTVLMDDVIVSFIQKLGIGSTNSDVWQFIGNFDPELDA